jgi:FkbM family methyltransferase
VTKRLIKGILPRTVWARLRVFRVQYTLAHYKRRRVRHNYGGDELELELIDPMGAGWYDHDWPVLPEIAFLKQHRLKRGAKVFDIGAHQCLVALMLSKAVGPEGTVVAVEANRENCDAGRRNAALNNAGNCKVLHAAGAARSGSLYFNQGLNGQVDDGGGEWGRIEVRSVAIDDLATEYGWPDVLFIDVEGFECTVLEGARKTLAMRPDCVVEAHVGMGLEKFGGSVERILGFFPSGYQFFVAPQEGKFIPLSESRPELLKSRFFLIAIDPERTRRPDCLG